MEADCNRCGPPGQADTTDRCEYRADDSTASEKSNALSFQALDIQGQRSLQFENSNDVELRTDDARPCNLQGVDRDQSLELTQLEGYRWDREFHRNVIAKIREETEDEVA
jgi:hypothetical protein